MEYQAFLAEKQKVDRSSGFDVDLSSINPKLFDWQKVIVRWAVRRGRAAIFADCGLGKTPMQLEWGRLVCEHEGGRILDVAPLAVAEQTREEGRKFGIPVNVCREMSDVRDGINITNYERLHKFDPSTFIGVILDESGILKNFSGVTRNEIIESFRETLYRLACTATPAPNDYEELGNHSEFLGVMDRMEMLSMFFINDTSKTGDWRLKGHVQKNAFWKWMASWAVMFTKPSDLGYPDGGFTLPPITYHEHFVRATSRPRMGFLNVAASTLDERREARKESVQARCEAAARLINSTDETWAVWCGLNTEGDLLEGLIDGAVQVKGSDDYDVRVDRLTGFASGRYRRIVTKPKIAGLGMNWQICRRAAFVGLSDSWEQFYQACRRIWRFGQEWPVEIHCFLEEREGKVLENIRRKDEQAADMVRNMVIQMSDLTRRELTSAVRTMTEYNPREEMRLPVWLS